MKSVSELNDLVHDSEEEGLWTSPIRKTVVPIKQHSRHSTGHQLFLHNCVRVKGYARTEQTLPLRPSDLKVSSETTNLYDCALVGMQLFHSSCIHQKVFLEVLWCSLMMTDGLCLDEPHCATVNILHLAIICPQLVTLHRRSFKCLLLHRYTRRHRNRHRHRHT